MLEGRAAFSLWRTFWAISAVDMVDTAELYKLKTKPLAGSFYRYIRTKYALEPLSKPDSERQS